MFERIQKRIDLYEELQQLRREVRVLRHENGIKTGQINDLMGKLKAAKARDKMHEDERANLNAQVIQRERDALEATENLKRQQHENAMLREQMEPLSCEGCIHAENYRKCASCARYPKIKDKYETEG